MKKENLLCCDNLFKTPKNGKCNGKYCEACLEKHYTDNLEELKGLANWFCYSCRRVCTCARCRRERGEKNTSKANKRSPTHSTAICIQPSGKEQGKIQLFSLKEEPSGLPEFPLYTFSQASTQSSVGEDQMQGNEKNIVPKFTLSFEERLNLLQHPFENQLPSLQQNQESQKEKQKEGSKNERDYPQKNTNLDTCSKCVLLILSLENTLSAVRSEIEALTRMCKRRKTNHGEEDAKHQDEGNLKSNGAHQDEERSSK